MLSQNKKYLSMLGLARKAGCLSMGHDAVEASVKNHKAKLVVFAKDISSRHINEIKKTAENAHCDICLFQTEETIDAFHYALGYKAGVISVNDINFSNKIKQLIQSENQEENAYGN